jgi:uncharacterized protein involved in outer membrane biogenesis
MRWTRLLLYLVLFMLVVVGGAAVFVLTLDLNNYKTEIAALTERLTGRTLELDGRVDLDLGALTTLELTNATFGNADWASEPHMARVGRAKLVVDLASILRGPIVVDRLEIDDGELHIELLEDGRNNWTFAPSADTDPESADEDPRNDDDDVFPLVLRRVETKGFLFTQVVPALARPLIIHAREGTQRQRDDGLLDVVVRGTINDRDVNVSGQYGPLRNLLSATNLQIDLDAQVDTLSISARGLIDDVAYPRRPAFEMSVNGPALDDVTTLLGLPDLGERGLDLDVAVAPDAEGVTIDISGNVGEFLTETRGRANELLAFNAFSVTTEFSGPDVSEVLALFGIDGVPGGSFALDAEIRRDGDRLDIDEATLELASAVVNVVGYIDDFLNLDGTNIQLQMQGEDVEQFRQLVGIPGAATGPFAITADLRARDDGTEMLDALLTTNIARLQITGGIVGTAPDFIGTTLALDGTGNSLADFERVFSVPNPIAEAFTIRGAVELGDERLKTKQPLTIAVGDDQLAIDGTIGYAPLEQYTDVRVAASGNDLAEVAAMAGVVGTLAPDINYDIRGGIAVRATGFEIRNLDAALGDSRLTASGLVSRAADLTGSRATFAASGPQLGALIADFPQLDIGEGPFELSGSAELRTDRLRVAEVALSIGGATATVDADIGLPLETASGQFEFGAYGPDLRAVLPVRPRWRPPDAPFKARATGSLADGLWTFETLSAQLAGATLTGNGVFDQPPDLSRTQLTIDAQIPNLSALGTIDGKALPPTNAGVNAGFAGSPESFSIEPFKALIGDNEIDGSVRVTLDGPVPEVDLRLAASKLDLDLFDLDEADVADASAPPEDDVGGDGDGRLIPDEPLPLDTLTKLNATADIDIRTARFRGIDYSDLVLDGKLWNGVLAIERLNAVSPYGGIDARFSVTPAGDSADVKADLTGTGLYIGLGPERTTEQIEMSPKFDAHLDLAASGSTYRDVAAALNGTIRISANGGRTPNTGANLILGGFFEELVNTVNPFIQQDPYTELDCLITLLKVEDGIAEGDPALVIQTDRLVIISQGRIDLSTEKLDINFRTSPRARLSVSAGEFLNPYLRVAGTLADPALTFDPGGAFVTSGAAVATGGLSLLATAVWNRITRANDPCAAAAKESDKKERKKQRD